MKRMSTLALMFLATLIAIPAAKAQGGLKADVPFAFTVGNVSLPAGEYLISAPTNGTVRLASVKANASATVTALKSFDDPNGKKVLVFERYGNQYFLHQILTPTTEALRVHLPMGRMEKRARSGEGILVAAR